MGYVKGLDLSDVSVAAGRLTTGTPVQVRFTDDPRGEITDFWFEVSDG